MFLRRLSTLRQRLRATWRDDSRDPEFQAEVDEHVRLLAERFRRQGMTSEAALAAARRRFGNTALLDEDRRAMLTLPSLAFLRHDLTYALRTLRKNPGFSAAAALTLALGIGANTAIFSVCNAVLFEPLPYARPERIVTILERIPGGTLMTMAPANYMDLRMTSRSFTEVAALNSNSGFILSTQSEAARLPGASVTANFFSVLGIRSRLGGISCRRRIVPDRTAWRSSATGCGRSGSGPIEKSPARRSH
jgi:hypothetical protein